jgi:hypothetical protein
LNNALLHRTLNDALLHRTVDDALLHRTVDDDRRAGRDRSAGCRRRTGGGRTAEDATYVDSPRSTSRLRGTRRHGCRSCDRGTGARTKDPWATGCGGRARRHRCASGYWRAGRHRRARGWRSARGRRAAMSGKRITAHERNQRKQTQYNNQSVLHRDSTSSC